MQAIALKLAQIGNSKGIRLPAGLIAKYHFADGLFLEEANGCLVLRPMKMKRQKLSWEETAKQMLEAKEDWSDWESMTDGLEDA